MTRQRQFELQAEEERRRWDRHHSPARPTRHMTQAYYSNEPRNTGNTLSPQEDVVEMRTTRPVVISERPTTTRTLLMENLLLLIVLGASVLGLYLLSIYLLNQTNGY